MKLHLHELIAVNDEFEGFFQDQTGVENVEYWECVYDPSQLAQQHVRIADHEPGGWVLLRNKENTYLLIEIGGEKKRWETWFAPDPKKILPKLRASVQSWQSLFPLIRQTHEEAHAAGSDKPNLTYLADLMTEAYHAANPMSVVSARVRSLSANNPGG